MNLERLKQIERECPTATFNIRDVVRLVETARVDDDGPENVSTVEASRILGYSPKRWRVWCEAGKVDGAWQDSEQGRWRLPLASCRAHLLRLANKSSGVRSSRRGPWQKSA